MAQPALKLVEPEADQPTLLDKFAWDLISLKKQEEELKKARMECEDAIARAIADLKTEGTTTQKTKYFKVSVTTKLTRTLDEEVWNQIGASINWPTPEAKAVEYKPTINLKALRHLESGAPDIYRKLSAAITTKPAKAAVKIEALDGN